MEEARRQDDERLSGSDGSSAPEALRASDDERQRVANLLGEHASVGRITMGELEERVGLAYAATTRADLERLTADLPDLRQATPSRKRTTRWSIAVMGGSRRAGRRRLSGSLNVVAVMGGDDIDLRQAEIDGSGLVINVFCLFGGSDIYLPDSVEIEVTGISIFGGNDERGSDRPARAGAPLIRIRSFAIFGGTDVWRLPAGTKNMSLRDARRAVRRGRSGA